MSVGPTNTVHLYYKGSLNWFFLCISLKVDPLFFDIYHIEEIIFCSFL